MGEVEKNLMSFMSLCTLKDSDSGKLFIKVTTISFTKVKFIAGFLYQFSLFFTDVTVSVSTSDSPHSFYKTAPSCIHYILF